FTLCEPMNRSPETAMNNLQLLTSRLLTRHYCTKPRMAKRCEVIVRPLCRCFDFNCADANAGCGLWICQNVASRRHVHGSSDRKAQRQAASRRRLSPEPKSRAQKGPDLFSR